MESVTLFVHKLQTGKKPSQKLINQILKDDNVPVYIKSRVSLVNNIIKGGSPTPDLIAIKPPGISNNCGGGGCVYAIKVKRDDAYELIDGILFKKLHDSIPEEIRKTMMHNLSLFLQSETRFSRDHVTSFKPLKMEGEDIHILEDHYGYFVRTLDGSIDQLEETPLLDGGKDIAEKIVAMNNTGTIHGDIKFPNILFKKTLATSTPTLFGGDSKYEFYIHDFDDVYMLETSGWKKIQAMFTPLYASPVYVAYRNVIMNENITNMVLDIKKYHTVTTKILGALVADPIKPIHQEIVKLRDKICNFVLKKTYNDFVQDANEGAMLRLIQYSDVYSLGVAYIAKALTTPREKTIRKNLHFFGESLLLNYFILSKIRAGGKKLKGGTVDILPMPTTRSPPPMTSPTEYPFEEEFEYINLNEEQKNLMNATMRLDINIDGEIKYTPVVYISDNVESFEIKIKN